MWQPLPHNEYRAVLHPGYYHPRGRQYARIAVTPDGVAIGTDAVGHSREYPTLDAAMTALAPECCDPAIEIPRLAALLERYVAEDWFYMVRLLESDIRRLQRHV